MEQGESTRGMAGQAQNVSTHIHSVSTFQIYTHLNINPRNCPEPGCSAKSEDDDSHLIFVVPCIMLNSEINPTRCNNCVYSSQWLYSTCFG